MTVMGWCQNYICGKPLGRVLETTSSMSIFFLNERAIPGEVLRATQCWGLSLGPHIQTRPSSLSSSLAALNLSFKPNNLPSGSNYVVSGLSIKNFFHFSSTCNTRNLETIKNVVE